MFEPSESKKEVLVRIRAYAQGAGLLVGPAIGFAGLLLMALDVLEWPGWAIAGIGGTTFALSALGILHTQQGEVEGLGRRISSLEAAARPSLTAECKTERGLRLGNDRDALAYLVIENQGGGQVRNVYVKVAEIIEHTQMSINGEKQNYRQRRYAHQDIYLLWDATKDRFHSFHTGASVRVALGRSGNGNFDLISDVSLPALHLFDTYELVLDIAADDQPVLRRTFLLRMEQCDSWRNDDGSISIVLGVPYDVEFREWSAKDQPDAEGDLDAIRYDSPPSADNAPERVGAD